MRTVGEGESRGDGEREEREREREGHAKGEKEKLIGRDGVREMLGSKRGETGQRGIREGD